MTAVPARRPSVPARRRTGAGPGQMLAEGTDAEIRAVLVKTGGTAIRGQKVGGGRLRVHIALPVAGVKVRWWQGRSWKFWTPIAAGGVVAFGGCLVAVVTVLKALFAAIVVIATMALGAAILIAGIAGLSSLRGGGSFSGTFKGRMD